MRVFEEGGSCLENTGGARWMAACFRFREYAARQLACGPGEGDVSVPFAQALILGDRSDLSENLRDAFAATGMLHVLAVSGLHVGIVAYVIMLLLQSIGVNRRAAVGLLIPMLAMYTTAVGWRASAVRAFVMSSILFGSLLFRRRADARSALALAAVVILALCPAQLGDPAFLLSFMAVIALLVVSPKLEAAAPWIKADPWQDDWSLTSPTLVVRTLSGVRKIAVGTLTASLAVWLVTAPLTVRWFHLFSPIALAGNLLVIPLAFLILFTGLLSLLFGAVHPDAGSVFNYANAVFIRLLMAWVEKLKQVPGGFFRVAEWPIEFHDRVVCAVVLNVDGAGTVAPCGLRRPDHRRFGLGNLVDKQRAACAAHCSRTRGNRRRSGRRPVASPRADQHGTRVFGIAARAQPAKSRR
jgi:ComEC/Rec2-related protein